MGRPQGWRVTGQDRRPAPAGTHRQAPGAFPVRAKGLRPAAAAQAGSPGGARIEAPAALREGHLGRARAVLATYGLAEALPQGGPEPEEEPPVRFFPNRLRRH